MMEETPLHLACLDGHLDVVRYLLTSHDANLEATDNDGHDTSSLGLPEGHLDVVRYLLTSHDANLEATDNDGKTPLHWACQSMVILKLLACCWMKVLTCLQYLVMAKLHLTLHMKILDPCWCLDQSC